MIPKIIWQTHKEPYSKLPKHMTDCSDTWKNFNPEYEYRYFDDVDMDSFIVEYFGQEWLDILNKCPIKIMKVDTWKYMILYIYGGVFVDVDYICKAPISSWSNKENNLIIFQDDKFLEFTQAVLASEPNNIILKETLDLIKHDLLYTKYEEELELVGRITGYKQFSIAIENILKLKEIDSINSYNDFNDLNIVKKMKIYTPYFNNWDRYNKDNELFYTVNGRVTWINNYGNWLKEQQIFQLNRLGMNK